MITLRRLDMVRKDSTATADELASLQTQLNSILTRLETAVFPTPVQLVAPVLTAGDAAPLPATPSGYVEFVIRGTSYVLPFYAKA